MGVHSIKLPDVGEGIAEAEVVEWLVKVGDVVEEDQIVAAVMTDKATVEIPTPVGGTVLALGAGVGSQLAIGAELFRLNVPGESDPKIIEPLEPAKRPIEDQNLSYQAPPQQKVQILNSPAVMPFPLSEKPVASPSVRLRARDAGIDLRLIRGTGPAGRISHEDVETFTTHSRGKEGGCVGRSPNLAVKEIKVIGMRRRIAQNMAESSRRVAHFSYVDEIDVTSLEDLRAAMNKSAGDACQKLTLLPFLMLAITKAVADFPQMNSLYDDEAEVIRQFSGVNIGIATQTQAGLLVPVVRHVEAKGLFECASEIARLSKLAREGSAGRDDLTGSTITITSLGAIGGLVTTPVINRPEVAIVGVNKMLIKPIWQENGFVPRKMMNLSSSFDHRVIDGYDAALFVQRVKRLLETPALIFIEA